MKSALPKVLHPLCGRSMLGHAIAAAQDLDPERLSWSCGHARDQVGAHVTGEAPDARVVVQDHQGGTGHAVRSVLETVGAHPGPVVVTYGDVPLLRADTLAALVAEHDRRRQRGDRADRRAAGPDRLRPHPARRRPARSPGSSSSGRHRGRARHQRDQLRRATPSTARCCATRSAGSRTDNARARSTSPTSSASCARRRPPGRRAACRRTPRRSGRQRPGAAGRRPGGCCNDRLLERWMRAGVTVVDPATTWMDVQRHAASPTWCCCPAPSCTAQHHGRPGRRVGPDARSTDTVVGAGRQRRAHPRQRRRDRRRRDTSARSPTCGRAPARRRRAKVGTFVEMKNADDRARARKVPHLTYVGDATIGEGSNIGAATVFVNYDGVAKHHTTIGDHVRTGADNMFVAPVDDRRRRVHRAPARSSPQDVPPGALGVARGRAAQHRRAGSTPAPRRARPPRPRPRPPSRRTPRPETGRR